ncbi:MAG TPA: HDOD domain-containing protein [Aquabacterium sp.]|uniref:HDOD domain-containing protein n=1 Tax=Aquabacterium sp. TaxID=1872578 RepID=UPI002DABCFEF|nr:HDOD domain-containing protein [Aquabacterium sp.]HET6789294.1 HDOD domain-containing protein [Aquabacterium sp.]HEX5373011.1 HDOD domain-containing protein [Aquabacterium sp.]
MQLDALFKQPQALPAVPKIVHELIDSFNNEDVSIDEITKKIASDPVLSARLLRLANSAYYHVSRTVGTVDDAVMMLGFVTVRTLVISSGLTSGFKSMPGMDLGKFWKYSLHTATVSRWLAKTTGNNIDQAFTVGLMHAIGQLVMHAGMPESMLHLDKLAGPLDPRRFDMERSSFGYNFATVGAELARQWKFPPTFAEAIEHFPEPLAHQPFNSTAGIIHLAAWRARAEHNGLNEAELAATIPTEVCQQLKLDPNVFLKEMPTMAELCEGMEALLG